MLMFAERWCDFSPRIRLGAWLLMLGFLGAVGALCCRQQRLDAAPVPLNAQWRKMMPLRVVTPIASGSPINTFSALDFDSGGSKLVSWQPVGAGGELTLEADWQSIPSLFTQLAACGRAVRGFSMLPEQQHLRLTLQLEAIGDD